ncbi:NAD(P)H-binding protein [Catenulispora sp. NF23]|uniref:NAD(P)H-binding protein n=1 Tax=Catenulispora pinistramenti TaxID=2705254 RepID=A0ABS5KKS2_9ACTN|nr:NAD(P)H-binding protein [Catenulispora pinistramenti]MBS2531186.1 NAD(P)H-binding protein [Catenulispora pinistramenti]MBS2546643.1 NAD(P)H-binding protein [Catenulispora pinistramenti]
MTILVTGASGGVGLDVMKQLGAEGRTVRAMSRRPLIVDLPDDVENFIGDPTNEGALEAALEGVDAVFVNSVFLNDIETARRVAGVLGRSLVERAVLLSSSCVLTRRELVFANFLRDVMDEFRSVFPNLVSVHPGQFASNALRWRDMVREGVVGHPFGDIRVPIIDPHDIAAVVKLCLIEDRFQGERIEITGSDCITPREMVKEISDMLGREIRYVEISAAQARENLSKGMSPDRLDYFLAMTGSPKPEEQRVLPAVENLTGSRPRSFATWLAANIDSFR